MENIFKNYFEQRIKAEESMKMGLHQPIITISREFGCPSKLIGLMLTEALNKRLNEHTAKKWKFINKEVVEEMAKRLELNPVTMNSILAAGEKGLVGDILKSFSPPYVTSLKVKQTLNDVIRSIAMEGRLVIVGRGSAAILQNFPETLHIRLHAPVEWRLDVICKSKNLSPTEGLRVLREVDKMRQSLIEHLLGRKMEIDLFDILFNCSRCSNEEIVHNILCLMESKKLI